jgi:uncharacterized linocin/CFP29 family protein
MFSRDLVPISKAALEAIDAQAASTLRRNLSARRFVDVKGPLGWKYSGTPIGRFEKLDRDGDVAYGVRQFLPLVESRVEFRLDLFELHNIDRGAADPDLVPVEKAAVAAAAFEDRAIYSGFDKASFKGFSSVASNAAVDLPTEDAEGFLRAISDEIQRFETELSIGGPFAIVGGRTLRKTLGGLVNCHTLFNTIEKNTDVDEFIFTPSSDDAFLVSKRGGDFELTLGGDFTVGYIGKEGKSLVFYLTESFAFRVVEPRAFTTLNLK